MDRELAHEAEGSSDEVGAVPVLRDARRRGSAAGGIDQEAWRSGTSEPPRVARDPRRPPSKPGGRMHVVLVPGFGGFDALGQIPYYAGTTQVADDWRRAAPDDPQRGAVVLHYFDNLPTAGVRTRAERLLGFLLKRVERNEFQEGDQIALVGHSTGGLDIRCLLLDLEQTIARLDPSVPHSPTAKLPERPPVITSVDVASRLRGMISRVVFLSVPQRGTNIADWTRSLNFLRVPLIACAAAVVDLSDVWGIQRLDLTASWLMQKARALVKPLATPSLVSAVIDVWAENSERRSSDPARAADAREALAELTLFLSHTNGDFIAIDDLAVLKAKRGMVTPLHTLRRFLRPNLRRSEENDVTHLTRAPREARAQERQMWRNNGIEVRSFATLGAPGAVVAAQRDAPKVGRLRPLCAALARPAELAATDFPYRIAYAACRAGPLCDVLADAASHGEPDQDGEGTCWATGAVEALVAWQNDGIVNTRSMLWPNGVDTRIVASDHGDIIGHFARDLDARYEAPDPERGGEPRRRGRRFFRYDIFASNSGFDAARFAAIWGEIFSFCATAVQAPVQMAEASE